MPASIGTLENLPLAICCDGLWGAKLPAGPTDGCHSCPFKVLPAADIVQLCMTCENGIIMRYKLSLSTKVRLRTSNGTFCKHCNACDPEEQPVVCSKRANGKPGSSYRLAGGAVLLLKWVYDILFLVRRDILVTHNGPVDESNIAARKRLRPGAGKTTWASTPPAPAD